MKQKLFCWGDDYRILDQDGQDVCFVDGEAFALLGKRLVFLDMAGNELAEIRQRLLSWARRTTLFATGRSSRASASTSLRLRSASSRWMCPAPTILRPPEACSTMNMPFDGTAKRLRMSQSSIFPGLTATASTSPTTKTMS